MLAYMKNQIQKAHHRMLINHYSCTLTYIMFSYFPSFSRKMDIKHNLCCIILLIITSTTISVSSLPSGGRDEMLHSTGRSILQSKETCPVNIETLNYNNLTSQCKQPWQAQPCCDAFRDLACPNAEQLNNLTYDCADRLFDNLRFLQYPDGLFSNLCATTKEGLPCPATTTKEDVSADWRLSNPSHKLMMFTVTFLLLLLGILGY